MTKALIGEELNISLFLLILSTFWQAHSNLKIQSRLLTVIGMCIFKSIKNNLFRYCYVDLCVSFGNFKQNLLSNY